MQHLELLIISLKQSIPLILLVSETQEVINGIAYWTRQTIKSDFELQEKGGKRKKLFGKVIHHKYTRYSRFSYLN